MPSGTLSGVLLSNSNLHYRINHGRKGVSYPELEVNHSSSVAFDDQDCPIAALDFGGFSPNKIINIVPQEEDKYENSLDFHIIETIDKSGNYFPVYHYPFSVSSSGKIQYLVTDKRAGESSKNQPLFYQHELMFDAYSNDVDVIKNVYKNNEITVPKEKYAVEYSYDLLKDGNSRYGSTTWRDLSEFVSSGVLQHRVRLLMPLEFFKEDDFYTVEYDKALYNAKSYQRELVELNRIYDPGDYKIDSSGIQLRSGGKIPLDTNELYLVKDPSSQIKALDIVSVKDQAGTNSYLPDKTVSWYLRLNVGAFQVGSGFLSSKNPNFYKLGNVYDSGYIPITNVAPMSIKGNVIRVKEAPIYIDEDVYTYPLYKVGTYDLGDDITAIASGKLGVLINGVRRRDILVSSIDRQKGYIQFDTPFDGLDEVEVSFYLDVSGYTLVDNLELNPSYSGASDYHISGYLSTGIGLAMRPYDAGADYDTRYPYLYDPSTSENSRTMYQVPSVGDVPLTANWTDYDFMKICELSVNRLSLEDVSITDARVPATIYDALSTNEWFKDKYNNNIKRYEKEWYTEEGYYGGYPLAFNSMMVIHVPEASISGMMQQWEDHLISQADIPSGDVLNYDDLRRRAVSEFKLYMDQTIRRYISAGSDYILISTTNSGTFDASKIMDLS